MSTTPRTTVARDEHNQALYISGGANTQDGVLKLYVCNTCHRDVVWATSNGTGRKYLANVFRGHLDQRYYVKASAHTCEPAIDTPAGPTEALLRSLKAQLSLVAEIRQQALAAGQIESYEKARDKARALRAQIAELENA